VTAAAGTVFEGDALLPTPAVFDVLGNVVPFTPGTVPVVRGAAPPTLAPALPTTLEDGLLPVGTDFAGCAGAGSIACPSRSKMEGDFFPGVGGFRICMFVFSCFSQEDTAVENRRIHLWMYQEDTAKDA
jgi:hypothetical protein